MNTTALALITSRSIGAPFQKKDDHRDVPFVG
jgi:hypothetical protein